MTVGRQAVSNLQPEQQRRGGASRSVASRRLGYVVAIVVDLALVFLVNVWPGWQVIPFLTPDTTFVIPIVNVSLVAGVVVNAIYLVRDTPLVRALGDLVTTSIALVVLLRLWQVFPFDLSAGWDTVTRMLLALVTVGCGIGVAVSLAKVVGLVASASERTPIQ
jgi:hypothetical protein